ncbi:MAG: lipid II flippase MurJ, partial [Pseudomonadota bacterium]
VKVMAPAFFAHQDTQSPFRYATGAVVVNLLGSLLTFRWFGHVGLALATALSAWTHVLLLYLGLRRHGYYVITASLWRLLWPSLVASSLLGAAIAYWAVPVNWLVMPAASRFAGVLVVSTAGLGLYLAALWVCGVRPRQLVHRV